LGDRISVIEKWIWVVVGGSIVVGFIMGKIVIPFLLAIA